MKVKINQLENGDLWDMEGLSTVKRPNWGETTTPFDFESRFVLTDWVKSVD